MVAPPVLRSATLTLHLTLMQLDIDDIAITVLEFIDGNQIRHDINLLLGRLVLR